MTKINLDDFLPNIDEHIANIEKRDPPNSQGLEEIINELILSTGLEKQIVEELFSSTFLEIRNQMFKHKMVPIMPVGYLYICTPEVNSKTKTFVKFKTAKSFKKKINKK